MSTRRKTTSHDGGETPKRLRSGTACAHCDTRGHHTRSCLVCRGDICNDPACAQLYECNALGCHKMVTCARSFPLPGVSGARACGGICGEIYCRAHREFIRWQCRRCFAWLCAHAAAGGERICYQCQMEPPKDKDNNA